MNTVQVILSMVKNLDWPLFQFDFQNAFLHENLTEKVHIDPTLGLPTKGKNVSRLNKALYGNSHLEHSLTD